MLNKILVIEDGEDIVEALRVQLKKENLDFVFAKNGRDGLAKLRDEGPFDAVLLDILLPDTDGFWFLEERSKDPGLTSAPVIILTNISKPDAIKKALDLGVKGYLIKANHSIHDLIEEVKKCVNSDDCIVG